MLKAAMEEKLTGRHVIIGIAHAHGVRTVNTLSRELPRVRSLPAGIAARVEDEMDLDEVVAWRPGT